MSWATQQEARDDLRNFLNDGPTDKLRHRQAVFGQINSSNVIFKTLEYRRITDLSAPTGRLGVFVNNAIVTVSADDAEVGEFTLAAAPDEGDNLEATFYVQWFLDAEIDKFLERSGQFLNCASTIIDLQVGLIPSAIHYSAGSAYQKLSSRYTEFQSKTFRLEEAPDDEATTTAAHFMAMAKQMFEQSRKLRDEFYKDRKGKAMAPISRLNLGRLRTTVPRR